MCPLRKLAEATCSDPEFSCGPSEFLLKLSEIAMTVNASSSSTRVSSAKTTEAVEMLLSAWRIAEGQRGSFLFPSVAFEGVRTGEALKQKVEGLTPAMWSAEREVRDLAVKMKLRTAFVRLRKEAQIIAKCEAIIRGDESTPSAIASVLASAAEEKLHHPALEALQSRSQWFSPQDRVVGRLQTGSQQPNGSQSAAGLSMDGGKESKALCHTGLAEADVAGSEGGDTSSSASSFARWRLARPSIGSAKSPEPQEAECSSVTQPSTNGFFLQQQHNGDDRCAGATVQQQHHGMEPPRSPGVNLVKNSLTTSPTVIAMKSPTGDEVVPPGSSGTAVPLSPRTLESRGKKAPFAVVAKKATQTPTFNFGTEVRVGLLGDRKSRQGPLNRRRATPQFPHVGHITADGFFKLKGAHAQSDESESGSDSGLQSSEESNSTNASGEGKADGPSTATAGGRSSLAATPLWTCTGGPLWCPQSIAESSEEKRRRVSNHFRRTVTVTAPLNSSCPADVPEEEFLQRNGQDHVSGLRQNVSNEAAPGSKSRLPANLSLSLPQSLADGLRLDKRRISSSGKSRISNGLNSLTGGGDDYDRSKSRNRDSILELTSSNRGQYYNKPDALSKYIDRINPVEVDPEAAEDQSRRGSRTFGSDGNSISESERSLMRPQLLCSDNTDVGDTVPSEVIQSLTRHLRNKRALQKVIDNSRRRFSAGDGQPKVLGEAAVPPGPVRQSGACRSLLCFCCASPYREAMEINLLEEKETKNSLWVNSEWRTAGV